MEAGYRVVYAENRGACALFETDHIREIVEWAENSPVSHQELEVYQNVYGSYMSLETFLDGAGIANDVINHPKHYTSYRGVEVIDLTEQMNFNRGNAVKYIARAGLKNPDTEVEDLQKALWYIRREIDRIKN
ncbi:thymidylate kinase [Streptomyces phage LibertyBell]|nr:thymidylate kinase [Streptomyces phage LibertyBell]